MSVQRTSATTPAIVFEQMAEIHRMTVPGGFITSLGPRFLARLYRTLGTSPHAFVYFSQDGDQVNGFIVGSMNTSRVYRDFLLRAGLPTLWTVGWNLLSVKKIRRMMETLLYPSRKTQSQIQGTETGAAFAGATSSASATATASASSSGIATVAQTTVNSNGGKRELPTEELISFCIHPECQGKGLGRALFEASLAEFASRGIFRVKIVTGADQLSAQKFYDRQGSQLVDRIEVHAGTPSLVYVHNIPATTN